MIKLKGKDMQRLEKRGARSKNNPGERVKPEPERAPAPERLPTPAPADPSPELARALKSSNEMMERIAEAQHRANISHATQMERLSSAIAELMKQKLKPKPWIFNIERDEKGRSRTIRAIPVIETEAK